MDTLLCHSRLPDIVDVKNISGEKATLASAADALCYLLQLDNLRLTCTWNMDIDSSNIWTLTASILPPFLGVAGGVREPPPAPSTPAGVLAEWCIRPEEKRSF